MTTARLIVYEKKGHWAAALRREVAGRVFETRSLSACWGELGDWPHSFLALELTDENSELLIGRLSDLGREFPGAAAVVMTERRLQSYQWLAREAGAVHFVVSPRRLGPVALVARRHLEAAPRIDLPLPRRIRASLPWSDSVPMA